MKINTTQEKSKTSFGAIIVNPKVKEKLGDVFMYNIEKAINKNENLQIFARKHDIYFSATKYLKEKNTEGILHCILTPESKGKNSFSRFLHAITGKMVKGNTDNPFEINKLSNSLIKEYREIHGTKEILALEKSSKGAALKSSFFSEKA